MHLESNDQVCAAALSSDDVNSELRDPELSEADVAVLAYDLWCERGCPHGSPDVDWHEAVRRLKKPEEHAAEC